jgi:sulfite reductase (NADPH) flavoprotein alpha-component
MSISQSSQEQKKGLSYKDPYFAHIKERYILNKPGSSKKTLHIALDLGSSGIKYDVGSCFGILPQNDPIRIKSFLDLVKKPADTPIIYKKTGDEISLFSFFANHANLNSLNSNFLKLTPNLELETSLKEFIQANDPLSFLQNFYTEEIPIQALCDCFQSLLPRYYSIASSQKKVGNEVHLMVATFEYEHAGQKKTGVTSSYLLDHCEIGETKIPIFLQTNPRFKLPENPNTPVIMIGPGTGLAPFVGFIQERAHTAPTSKNWLFFGERHKKQDFYYEEFLQTVAIQGLLKLDLAFSRDQEEKIYVQHKIILKGAELWQWVHHEKANIYICGDAKEMAKDVTKALVTIFQKHGNMDSVQAENYLLSLRKDHRIHLDVY